MRRAVLIVAFAALAGAQPALAGVPAVAMDVAPTTLELKPGAVDLFYVANHGVTPVTVQLEGFDWSQTGDADTLTPSAQLISSSAPIFGWGLFLYPQ